MPHIHTKPGQIDHTVSAYIIRTDMDELRVLLHMHKKHNRLLQIGGHIEIHETVWGALAHEVEEESGYQFDSLEVMQPEVRIDNKRHSELVHPVPFYLNTHDVTDDQSHFHTDIAYLLLAHQEPQGSPGPEESQDLRWLSLADLEACTDEEMYPGAKLTCIAALTDFYPTWQPIPTSHYRTDKTTNRPSS